MWQKRRNKRSCEICQSRQHRISYCEASFPKSTDNTFAGCADREDTNHRTLMHDNCRTYETMVHIKEAQGAYHANKHILNHPHRLAEATYVISIFSICCVAVQHSSLQPVRMYVIAKSPANTTKRTSLLASERLQSPRPLVLCRHVRSEWRPAKRVRAQRYVVRCTNPRQGGGRPVTGGSRHHSKSGHHPCLCRHAASTAFWSTGSRTSQSSRAFLRQQRCLTRGSWLTAMISISKGEK